jgi:hypothetical protein
MEHESTRQDISDSVVGTEYRFCELGLPSMRAGYALTGYAVLNQARPDKPPYR